ncbi:hypothetical protein [Vibrio sp. WXL210]|uniref:hypothetical protein n=1 Tax=Vibrio sp. WXL210 TaxID=3450709 RepID=UPI003EC8FB48
MSSEAWQYKRECIAHCLRVLGYSALIILLLVITPTFSIDAGEIVNKIQQIYADFEIDWYFELLIGSYAAALVVMHTRQARICHRLFKIQIEIDRINQAICECNEH